MSEPLIERLAQLAQIGAHEHGIDRAAMTAAEHQARAMFATWARASGYALRQDGAGNLFARREGTRADAAPILIGSHLDTVPTGGAYDGAYGVVGALCALERLDANGARTKHPLEAVAWTGEEGSRFPLGCLGSSVFSGLWNLEDALHLADADGTMFAQALSGTTGLLPAIEQREKQAAAAYLELHVEQGPVLEREGIGLGVVTAIAGQRRYRITVEGESGHAGTVPMALRADALCAAAELVLCVEIAARDAGETVATVGRMHVDPGGTNVIPSRVVFSLDVRSLADARIDVVEARFEQRITSTAQERRVRIDVERLEARAPAPMDERMRAAVHRAIASMGEAALDMTSGAGHDAMCLSRVAPSAMIFVPSEGGSSHVASERTAPGDLVRGVEALAAAIIEVDACIE